MTEQGTPRVFDQKGRLLGLLVGLPALVGACALGALEAWRWERPDAPLFNAPIRASFSDAIARNDSYGSFTFIRAGQDPNGVIAVQHPVLTAGRQVEVPPLLWAVATQSERSVAMLLAHGARPEPALQHRAVCLAEHLGRPDIVLLLRPSKEDAAHDPCPLHNGDNILLSSPLH